MTALEDFGPLQTVVREWEPLGRQTWLGVGGRARWFAEPTSVEQLAGHRAAPPGQATTRATAPKCMIAASTVQPCQISW